MFSCFISWKYIFYSLLPVLKLKINFPQASLVVELSLQVVNVNVLLHLPLSRLYQLLVMIWGQNVTPIFAPNSLKSHSKGSDMGVHLLPVFPWWSVSWLQISHTAPWTVPVSSSPFLDVYRPPPAARCPTASCPVRCPSQPPLEPHQLCRCTSLPPAGELLPQWTLCGPILVPTLMRCSCFQIQPLILILLFFFLLLLIWKCLPRGHYRPGGLLWSANKLVVPGSFAGWAWETWGVSIKGILGHIFVPHATTLPLSRTKYWDLCRLLDFMLNCPDK